MLEQFERYPLTFDGPTPIEKLSRLSAHLGDAVEIYPTGRTARVRGLQSFGISSERVNPGARCAVNLQGVELGNLSRGLVVSLPGALQPTSALDAEITLLPEAPAITRPTSVRMCGNFNRPSHGWR